MRLMVSSSSETPLVEARWFWSWFTSTDWLVDWFWADCDSTPRAEICCAYWSPIVAGPEVVVTNELGGPFRPASAVLNDVPFGADSVSRTEPVSRLMMLFGGDAESAPTVIVAGLVVVPSLTFTVGGV